ncbi:hypothetical protein [Thalassospira sp.]|uniref:hypothetical protein n=1 Tax=Thalassospira sp. TaxID=1912094 RepID=UPI003AA974E8
MNFKALAALLTALLILMTTGHTVMAKTMETKTYCVGRLLIDVPTEFEVMDFGGSINGLKIERVGAGNEKDLQNRIADRIQALEDKKVIEGGDPVIFLGTDEVGGFTIIKHILDTSSMGQITEPWTEEAYVLSDVVLFHLIGTGTKDKLDFYRENMLSVANAIHPRELNEIPSEPGFCLKDAFVAVPQNNENAHALFRDPEQFVGMEVDFLTRKAGERDIDLTAPESKFGNSVLIAGLKGREAKDYGKEFFFHAAVGSQVSASHNGYAVDLSYFDRRKNFGSEPYSQSFAEKAWENLIEGTAE